MVPVIRDAQNLSMAGIESEIKRFGEILNRAGTKLP